MDFIDSKHENQRLREANELLRVISSCGHRIFYSKYTGQTAKLVIRSGKVWIIDENTQTLVFVHYTGRWKFFSHGNGVRRFVEMLREYVKHGTRLSPLFFWPQHDDGISFWRYGDDAEKIINTALAMGMIDGQLKKAL